MRLWATLTPYQVLMYRASPKCRALRGNRICVVLPGHERQRGLVLYPCESVSGRVARISGVNQLFTCQPTATCVFSAPRMFPIPSVCQNHRATMNFDRHGQNCIRTHFQNRGHYPSAGHNRYLLLSRRKTRLYGPAGRHHCPVLLIRATVAGAFSPIIPTVTPS